MTTIDPKPTDLAPAEHDDVVCHGCGCLCDDITAVVSEGRIVEARRSCPIGEAWFRRDAAPWPDATIDGQPATMADALDRAAEILGTARRPIVLGLSGVSIEAQSAAVALAEELGAAIDPGIGRDREPLLRATQRVGRASATLGEIRNRADLVVFWGVDPVTTHPRHLERYSGKPVGRFLPNGRGDRTIVVIDEQRTPTADVADLFLAIPRDGQFEAIWTLRAIVRGTEIGTRACDAALIELAERLTGARYAAIFFGPGLGRGSNGAATAEALLLLVRDLNARTRCVAMTLGGAGNASGATAVLAWRSGFASAVDFGRGFPSSLPGEADADAVLARREADAALIVANEAPIGLSSAAMEHLGRIPVVAIGPGATDPIRKSAVALTSSRFGVDSGGSILRSDGVMLTVRPILVARHPSDLDLIRAIRDRLRKPIAEVAAP